MLAVCYFEIWNKSAKPKFGQKDIRKILILLKEEIESYRKAH